MPNSLEKRSRGRPRTIDATKDGGSVQSLDRAVHVLEVLSEADGLSLSEVAAETELPASTAHRLLTTLEAHGLVEFDPARQLWYVGVEMFRLGSAFLRRRKIAERGRDIIQDLVVAHGETANLAVAEEDCVVFVAQVETHEAIRAFFRPGTRSPFHASGIGKAVLAFWEPGRVEALIRRSPLTPFTPTTLTTREALLADLEQVKARGFSIDDEERHPGMRCVAAPVFDEFARPIGGVSISGPTVRMTDAKAAQLGPQVAAAAAAITQAIGGRVPK